MKTLWLIAFRNLLQNGKRTLLLGSAIASVTLLLVLMSAVGNGMYDTILTTATNLTTGHVNVAGFYKITSGQAAPVVTKFEPLREKVREVLPPGSVVVDRLRGWGKVVSPKSSIQVGIGGIDIDQETGFRSVVTIAEGSVDGLREPNGVLMFEGQAKRLGLKVGDDVTIAAPTVRAKQRRCGGRHCKSIGLLSAFNMYVSQLMRELYLLNDSSTGALQVYIQTRASEAVAEQGETLHDAGYPHGPMEKCLAEIPIVTREVGPTKSTSPPGEMNRLSHSVHGALTAVLNGIFSSSSWWAS